MPDSLEEKQRLDLTYCQVPKYIKEIDHNFVITLSKLIPKNSKILDVGCGTGSILKLLKGRRKDLRLFGLDSSSFMVSEARQRNITIKLGDAKKIPYADSSFDVVLSSSLLHHIDHPIIAIREMLRVTKKEGQVIIRDLRRPKSNNDLERILSNRKSPKAVRLLLKDSLMAAQTINELKEYLYKLKIDKYRIIKRGLRYILIINK
ncbi:class I SAM-dependent methyltransferase [Patescibacteria group bacterium]